MTEPHGEALSIDGLDGVSVGHVSDPEALTGCTAVIFPAGAVAGHVAWGTATGSRELAALSPRHMVQRIHGVCLSGGSAFGLAAASGVAQLLEAESIGHITSRATVPIVAGAVVYDLALGNATVRPDEAMGREAARRALANADGCLSGNVGAGAGVSAGKLMGPGCATKSGIGNAGVLTAEGLGVAALVVANPVGDILTLDRQRVLCGVRRSTSSSQLASAARLIRAGARCAPLEQHNTTLCVVCTNAALDRQQAQWLAEQALVGLARGIDPPFTQHDGDVVFAASVGQVSAEPHRLALLARDAVGHALVDACLQAQPAGGLPSCHDLEPPPAEA